MPATWQDHPDREQIVLNYLLQSRNKCPNIYAPWQLPIKKCSPLTICIGFFYTLSLVINIGLQKS